MKKRFEALDCLRGIAALLVMFHHYSSHEKNEYIQVPGVSWSMDSNWAYHAVHLFFIISGFVIFMSVERVKQPIDFVKARFFRLYPTFWTSVTLTTILLLIFGLPGRSVGGAEYLFNMTMIAKFLTVGIIDIRYIDGSYWTLEYEFFFYVIMFALLCTKTLKQVDWIMLGLLVWSYAYTKIPYMGIFLDDKVRHITLTNPNVGNPVLYFAAGIFVYRWKQNPQQYLRYGGLLLFDLLLIGLDSGKMNILISAGLMLTVYFSSRIQEVPKVFKPMVFFGAISYSLYLVHQVMGFIVLRELGLRGVGPEISFAVAVATSVAVATAICYGIEKPTMKLSKRFTGRKPEPIKIVPDGALPEQAQA